MILFMRRKGAFEVFAFFFCRLVAVKFIYRGNREKLGVTVVFVSLKQILLILAFQILGVLENFSWFFFRKKIIIDYKSFTRFFI